LVLLCSGGLARAQAGSDGSAGASGDGGESGEGAEPPAAEDYLSLRMPGANIPANGAILLEGASTLFPENLEVRDEAGELLEGAATRVGVGKGTVLFAWLPTQPFVPGSVLSILQTRAWDGAWVDVGQIEIIADIDGEPPAVLSEPSANGVTITSTTLCCRTPAEQITDRCIMNKFQVVLDLDAGLSSTASAAQLNQYLFAIALAGSSEATPANTTFMPLDAVTSLRLVEPKDEYCFELDAFNIATYEIHRYRELGACVARGEIEVGVRVVEPGPIFFDLEHCPKAPPDYETPWCEANADACDEGSTDDCELLDYNCNDGPLPLRWQVRSPDDRVVVEETTKSAEGCHVLASSSHPRAGAPWLLLALAYLARRSKRA